MIVIFYISVIQLIIILISLLKQEKKSFTNYLPFHSSRTFYNHIIYFKERINVKNE